MTWSAVLAAWLLAGSVLAHTPFGSSIRAAVGTEIQVDITMGINGSTAFLNAVKQPTLLVTNVSYAHKSGSGFSRVPQEVVPRLFELRAAGTIIRNTDAEMASDGREVLFRITFSQPKAQAGELELTASFLKEVENFERCPLVATDEQGGEIAAAILSVSHPAIKVLAPRPKASSPSVEVKPETVVATSARALIQPSRSLSSPALIPHPSWGQFFWLGVEHILTGIDHLLFLGALLVCLRRIRPMLWVLTCFTLAHSVTLALSVLNLVVISSRLIEPLIAASIIAVGVGNLVRENQADRLWLAGGFGLIHGFGFAGALRETGLARSGAELPMPLLSFNCGVEAGQLAVAAVVIPVLMLLRQRPAFARFGVSAVSGLIITISSYWLVQRILIGS